MSFSKMIGGIFGIVFIVILYVIIYYALKIMYKDVKNGGKRRRPSAVKGSYGLEIIKSGNGKGLKDGSIIPIRYDLTIGRKENNSIVLADPHVSGSHAKIIVRNNGLFIEDFDSTNGTYVNRAKVNGKMKLSNRDEIKIGTAVFKILS
ncbi:FHA domain-containing protein [Clostridium saccharobutylicum]|uniref:FHA domain containing protein n=1 Tax=Clostridium saccharobutylicum DSM 13864 TaxID=1345695 RepID=U5N0E2_CLOSA|nr:FHA domain-containing protein [Clostridium saccharobutylicum]AGX45262.1 FHA domain containing protein [Clostridium saccharobutylicum DSM 13864]AQR92537.1 FHA domain-containing protein FhaB [Clostridium saccharobutylicum]AQS02440.1 FHA domain-containing protein FhaB [Clostridium saccharobutylicum]AQS12043.1 FHA domain-containing protein FhaB [Clostridium saccharobutylicum]AQS16423.1 FHA domain-containing protein FhaB [Clostridium saccharobutylicum]